MRLYLTVWDDGVSDRNYEFSGTQADHKALQKRLRQDGDDVVRSEEIDVPTDKPGLLQWLNTMRVRPDQDGGVQ